MEKFASVKNCSKCGDNIFTPTYNDFTGKRKYVPATVSGTIISSEHLEVTCSKCGYTWTEECADSQS